MTGQRDYVSAAILRGASARWFEHPITDNPYAEAPGSYVLHNAWLFGWNNSEDVLEANRSGRRAAEVMESVP